MAADLSYVCIDPDSSIRQAMDHIDHNGKGIVLVCDREGRLQGTITDGDIRRAVLVRQDLDSPVSSLLADRDRSIYPVPVTAAVGTDPAQLIGLMREKDVRQVPLLDPDRRVVDLVTLYDLVPEQVLPMQAVIMAGGYGKRMRPLTDDIPKPMLPLGDRPLMERIIEQLHRAGIRRVNLVTHYKGEVIENHFGDGGDFGMEIGYVREDRPLGTVGGLGRLEADDEPILLINGDILTGLDFRAMLEFHREQKATMTVAVREYELRVPYGVIETSGVAVTAISEKPLIKHFINAGIYILDREACSLVPEDEPCDMPELISRLVDEKMRVVSFPVREYWQDIGRPDDYRRAETDLQEGRVKR